MSRPSPIPVVCLILVDASGCVLATQRPLEKHLALKWEFPGGKLEAGEQAETALRREIKEELGIEVGPLQPLEPVEHTYETGRIRLIPFLGTCQDRPKHVLHEHADAQWIHLPDWEQLEWASADIPVIRQLLNQ